MSGARKTVADMARSILVMAVVVGVLLFIGPAHGLLFASGDRMPPVSYTDQVSAYRQIVGADALVPGFLPHGWRANNATFTQADHGVVTLHIGWVTPGNRFAGLDESTDDAQSFVPSIIGTPRALRGDMTIGGRVWHQSVSARGEQAFVYTDAKLVVVITGNATDAQLRALAASLV